MTRKHLAEILKVLEEYDHHKLWMPLVEEIARAVEFEPTLLDIMSMSLEDALALRKKLGLK